MTAAKPLISVLVPVYNAASTVELALGSLSRQTFGDFEAVVVDDGSTDGTAEVVERAASSDGRIRLVRSAHVGLVRVLNLGIEECRGELIARMDGDDICHPQRLRIQLEYMLANPDISVCSTLVRSFPQSAVGEGFRRYERWQNCVISHDDVARDIFVESPVAHPSVMLRASELRELGGYLDLGWPEDYDLWLRYFVAGKRFAKIPWTLLFWRAHEERLTWTDSRYSLENFIRAKAHYLSEMLRPRSSEIVLWGAGMTGRRISKHLVRKGLSIRCVVDIDPKKIGRTMRGIPIISPDDLATLPPLFIVAAVGSESARGMIREFLSKMGRTEVQDFLCAA